MEMKPKELSHVIAMVDLFRPGPMKFIPTYIRRMHGEEEVSYLHPALEPIFSETYGIPVYQEQIMFAAMDLVGYFAADADHLRKAISKKDDGGLKEYREKFVQGAAGNGIPPNIADQIFNDWENFARYGFNRAHAAAYGTVAVQTAHLKANYPIEYMTALMSVFREYPERTAGYITDCRRMGIGVLRPSVNKSGLDFTIEASSDSPDAIRYGLGGIKTVGDGAAAHIVEARELKGEFSDVVNFALRVDLRRVGKRALESLIKVGALDDFGPRSVLLDQIDQLSHDSGKHHQALSAGQMTLFTGKSNGISTNHSPDQPMDVSKRQQLVWERELLGTYVSDHPIASKMDILGPLISHYSSEIQDASQNELVIVAGGVTGIRTILTRRDE
jgi:DNA polymerase-3 subunit alpha